MFERRQSEREFDEACLFQNIENGFYFSEETPPFPNVVSQKISRTLWNSWNIISVEKIKKILQRGAVRGLRVKLDRVFLFSVIRYYKKNIIRELWMICLSWHVKAKSYFSWIVKLGQKSAIFSVKMDLPCKRICKKDFFWCSQIAWVKYETDFIEYNKQSLWGPLRPLKTEADFQRYQEGYIDI